MKIERNDFHIKFQEHLKNECRCTPKEANVYQIHTALARTVLDFTADSWQKSQQAHNGTKKACYFSAEFLVGRAVFNNLLCLGLLDEAEEVLSSCGVRLSDLEEIEDAALGNGGLGRLAACFLDSAATLNLPLEGYGIRYRYGLFKQSIENGFQKEQADNWQQHGDPWSFRCEEDAQTVVFKDQTVRAVPYDMPVFGYGTGHVCTLRLWQAEPLQEFDFTLFNEQKYAKAVEEKNTAEDISRVLYPNDDTNAGKRLRLKQQYFFCCASLSDLLKTFKREHGDDFSKFPEYTAIQLNDTHPVIAIPELIRQLMDNEGLPFGAAFAIAQKTFHYTNHTIMAEALEKWDRRLMASVVPRVYAIIRMIQAKLLREMKKKGLTQEEIENLSIITDRTVHMARLAIFASSHTNGVAKIHTEILKQRELHNWYELYPERFQNKTNGVTQRRWLGLCNRELSGLISRLLGGDGWLTDLNRLSELKRYADDEAVLKEFMDIKRKKKQQLAAFVLKQEGTVIDPNSLFDIQIKRLHEYKRQLLNAFSILMIYFGIKDGSIKDFTPTTFLFGAKAAPGYARAKGIIKYIGEIARLIDADPQMRGLLKVVFVQNYNVSYAEKLVAAADISEQISMAGTEASGTGNMKLMLNGAVTLGTLDGANVEIVEAAGPLNNYIFGAKVEELAETLPKYNPKTIYNKNKDIRRAVDTLIDGTFDDGGTGIFKELHSALLKGASWHKPDHYYVLGDLESYMSTKLQANREYTDSLLFARKCFLNMCSAGPFSSDRTVADYAENIWGISPVDGF